MMLSKPIRLLQLALLLTLPLQAAILGKKNPPQEIPEAEVCSVVEPCQPCEVYPGIEVKAGYFFFGSSTMRDVYDEGGIDVQLSGSYSLWKWLGIYSSVEYFQRSGHTLNAGAPTQIQGVPISLGLKPVFSPCDWLQYYFAIGPRYVFVWSHFDSSELEKHLDQNGFGGFVNTGFNFYPFDTSDFFIDLFAEYSYVKLDFHPHKENVYGEAAQVGGFTFGGGLGYAF
jgi:hypothetical protein